MGSSKQQDYAGAARAGVGRKSAKPLIKHAHAALHHAPRTPLTLVLSLFIFIPHVQSYEPLPLVTGEA